VACGRRRHQPRGRLRARGEDRRDAWRAPARGTAIEGRRRPPRGAELINGRLIRTLSPQEVAARVEALIARIQADGLLPHPIAVNYAIVLFTWHGCIHMAKNLRPTYQTATGEAPYSLKIRRHGYQIIERSWREAEAEGNPFVRYGVTLARPLEVARGNRIIDDWVPRESPYREEPA
jgi:hypothetical protein